MKSIVVDTSVVIKWYSEELNREKAVRLLEFKASKEIDFIFPQEIILELSNVLHFGKKFSRKECKDTIESFLSLNSKFVNLQKELVNKTIELSFKYRIASYDALFIAVAETCDVPLITADYKHHQKRFSQHITWLADWSS